MIRKFVATLLLITLPSLPALAGSGNGKGNGKGKGNSHQGGGNSKHGNGGGGGQSWGNEHDGHDHSPRFSDNDRNYWSDYWHDEYERGNCPPGLAKKHNGCMPPGQAKKRYQVGYPVPAGIVVLPVPVVLLPRLSPCPPGYYYGMVDGDLVKLAVGTMLVVDAIDGLTSR